MAIKKRKPHHKPVMANLFDVTNTILVGEKMGPGQVLEKICNGSFSHIVQSDSLCFKQELSAAHFMLSRGKQFLLSPIECILGVEKSTRITPDFTKKVSPDSRKADILNEFGNFMNEVKGVRTVWDNAFLCADEIFTNGTKNAWRKDVKIFTGPIAFPGEVELFAAADEKRMIVGCRDSYGRLNVHDVLKQIYDCYEKGVAQSIRHGLGGAGIGSFLIFESCVSYYLGVDPGHKTVVCASFPLGISRRAAAGLTKNIHVLGKGST